jgi:hypothetical protein
MESQETPQRLAELFQDRLNEQLGLHEKPPAKIFRWLDLSSGLAGSHSGSGLSSGKDEQRKKFENWCLTHYLDNRLHRVAYCPIEKNACTYFKDNLLANSDHAAEYQDSGLDPHSFIKNRKRMRLQDLQHLKDPDYLRFVIVREPIERTVSAYINKFVRNRMYKMALQAVEQYASIDPTFDQPRKMLTFRMFVRLLENFDDAQLDHHWRSQISFVAPLVDCFDWIVPMERIAEFLPVLEKRMNCNFPREKSANQNIYEAHRLRKRFYDKYPARLRLLEHPPGVESLMLPEFDEALRQRFALDFELYQLAQKHFELKLAELSAE